MKLALHNLSRRFGNITALNDVSLEVESGELAALLGPSGCGKTTLLRIIAGPEQADAGRLLFAGRDATMLPARERAVGFVFQNYALFPHMTVFENIAFGLRVRPRDRRPAQSAIAGRVHELLALVQLDDVGARLPAQLSGGQRRLHDEMPVTGLFVTHDQDEALKVADRVVVMNRGRIELDGLLVDAPAHGDVADGAAVVYAPADAIEVHRPQAAEPWQGIAVRLNRIVPLAPRPGSNSNAPAIGHRSRSGCPRKRCGPWHCGPARRCCCGRDR